MAVSLAKAAAATSESLTQLEIELDRASELSDSPAVRQLAATIWPRISELRALLQEYEKLTR